MAAENIFLVVNLIMLASLKNYFSTTFLSGLVLFGSSLHSSRGNFLKADLSQGSVATFVRCGGTKNLLQIY